MPNLRSTLDSLAHSFASSVLDAIRSASIADLHAETGGGPGRPRGTSTKTTSKASRDTLPFKPVKHGSRLARRTPEDIAKTLGLVVAAVKAKPMRAEEIGKFLKLDKRELPRVLKQGLAAKKLRSKGQKRATTYSAA
jgi:hypothetical protein